MWTRLARLKPWRQEARRKTSELAEAYRMVFGSNEGRVVLADLMRRGNFWTPVTEPGDAIASAYADGARSLVLSILKIMGITEEEPEAILNMLQGGE